ncbi:hypothetical protein D9615_005779 [Tricholomella constricta]|uniref:Uncharacterized protein n=1 Tax=Tricholomella constricta TaxID=117010 RepID=A0A8H5HAB7_9AGAR|nr:hypothetical protein D9615_005779 [Tricholomella constricta]
MGIMLRFDAPSVDENNPLYCPSVTAASYLESLRHQRRPNTRGKPSRNDRFLQSFARILEKALVTNSNALGSSDDESYPELLFKRPRTTSTSSEDSENLPNFSYAIPAWERDDVQGFWGTLQGNRDGSGQLEPVPLDLGLKRKRERFSDLRGPPAYARSAQSVQDSSFDVVVKHEKLSYFAAPGSIDKTKALRIEGDAESVLPLKVRDLGGQLYGSRTETESPRSIQSFIELLDRTLPGIRLKERLAQLSVLSHQSIVDFLGANGYLNSRVLALFRTLEVRWITLTESLQNANGLNLCGDILPSFSQPNNFLFLSELSLRDTQVSDFDLTYIQRLPKLSTLLLDNSAISNEALTARYTSIFLLVPLKRSLTQLSIGSNPGINDDAVPALLLLTKLSFLSILDTSIHMPGLRRLARTIYDEDRVIDIEIPTACENYVDPEMHKMYALDPRPPLITDPDVCAQLSTAALQRNLGAHAAKNSDIIAAGGKVEMVERLRGILEMRRADMLVRDMILGVDAA